MKQADLRNQALSAVAGGIAAKEPTAALALATSLEGAARTRGIYNVFQTMIDRDFDAALSKAEAMPDEKNRQLALKAILGIRHDSGDSFGNSSSADTSNRTAEQLRNVISKLPEGSLRTQALTAMAQNLVAYPTEKRDVLLGTFTEKEQIKIKSKILNSLYYKDPIAAWEIYQSLPAKSMPSHMRGSLITQLARVDPEKALGVALASKSANVANTGVANTFKALAAADPDAALQRLTSIPEGALRDAAFSSIASTWSETDPKGALRWAGNLQDDKRIDAICKIIPNLADSDSQASAKLITSLISKSDANVSESVITATTGLIEKWSRADASSAAIWAESLPQGSTKSRAYQSLTKQWLAQDREKASAWVNSLPKGEMRDVGVNQIIAATQHTEPDTAFKWASSLSNSSQRLSRLRSVVRRWKNTDPAKARAAIEQANLTEAEHRNLTRTLDQ